MFVVQPVFPSTVITPRAEGSRATPWLVAWAIAGGLVLVLGEAARGGPLFGLTLPFWLVGAPLLDLAWVERRRLGSALRRQWQRRARRAPVRRRTVRHP
jgi:hypothetical protein